MSADAPSQLPADIASEIKLVITDLDQVKALLASMVETDDKEEALGHFILAKQRVGFAQDAARKALAYFGAAVMTGMVEQKKPTMIVVATRGEANEIAAKRVAPRDWAMRAANDHTLDDEPQQQLTLAVGNDRHVAVNGDERKEAAHG